jgi:hypothetical protein
LPGEGSISPAVGFRRVVYARAAGANRKEKMQIMKNKIKRAVAVVAVTSAGAASAFAQTTFADPSTITTTATTVFTGVATLMVGIVGFWVVLKIVRKISGK